MVKEAIASFVTISLLLAPQSVLAGERQLADWGVHTVVTSGPRTYEGTKTRAILSYGELGAPRLFVESIEVVMAYPVESKLLWRTQLKVTGGVDGICSEGESGFCDVEDLRWKDSELHHRVVGDSGTLGCVTHGIASREPRTSCVGE